MNASEANRVLRKVLAYCPAQSVDEYTPDAWAEALDDIRAADALEVVARIGRRELQPGERRFIEPGHIRAEVRRIRADRLERHGDPTPPPELSPADYAAWLRAARAAIADGHPPTMPELEPDPGHARRLAALITGGTHE